mgnify:CR=1 FL=1
MRFVLKEKRVMLQRSNTRKSTTTKMKPGIIRKARVRAASSDKRLGEWLEEAIEEKAAREETEEHS